MLLLIALGGGAWVCAQGGGGSVEGQGRHVDFLHDVRPLMDSLGCNAAACHGSAGGGSGLGLSLFGADPKADYAALTRAGRGRYVDPLDPTQSLVLQKACEMVSHQGGKLLAPIGDEYRLLEQWIAQGAVWSDPNRPDLKSIEVSPADWTFKKGQSQALSVTGVLSDGSRLDVTNRCRFLTSDPQVATVDKAGTIRAVGFGQSTIVATYLRKAALARVMVPQDLPWPFPQVQAGGPIDDLVTAKLRQLGIPPSDLCSDEVFLRRVYLDVTGMLPTPDQAKAFLADKNPAKRSGLIDDLLQGEAFADFWALKWGDLLRVKSEYPSNLWPNAVQAYYRWIRDSIRRNKPIDRFARELLVSSGSDFRSGPANYYRAFLKRDPQDLSDATSLVFLGERLGCARCHAHPMESWNQAVNLGMAAFFAKVGYKKTLEWKEEVVYFNPKGELRDPATGELVRPTFLDGGSPKLEPGQDPRIAFADWLTDPNNPLFSRAMVNRVWFWLMGRGIVHEPDDMRPTNPPANPELLDYLAKQLVDHRYDLRHVYRLILNSRTYQLSSAGSQWNAFDQAYLSHYQVRRLPAEVLLDAIGQVTQTSEPFSSRVPEPYTVLPEGHRAVEVSDGSIGTPFLELFGRPTRDAGYESDRDNRSSVVQALHMLNSRHVQSKISSSPRLRQWSKSKLTDGQVVEEIYLSALSRYPTAQERQTTVDYMGKDPKSRAQAMEDVVWSVFNTKEFLFNH